MGTIRWNRWIAFVGVATAACGSDLVLPEPGGDAVRELDVVDGDGQTGTVGQTLPFDVVVVVRDATGEPVEGERVVFRADDGRTLPDTAYSRSDGRAAARWTLGTEAGTQRLEARVGRDGVRGSPVALAAAIARPGDPALMAGIAGNGQTGLENQVLPMPLVVVLTDAYNNPVAGVPVSWLVTSGRGTVSGSTVPTGSDGRAQVTWRLGSSSRQQRVSATVDGVPGSPVIFEADAIDD